jgi:hypothetical protein
MDFNYRLRAGLFAPNRHSGTLVYYRFATLAEAIRFVIEELSPAHQLRAFIDIGDETLSIKGIHDLYENEKYPLRHARRTVPHVA